MRDIKAPVQPPRSFKHPLANGCRAAFIALAISLVTPAWAAPIPGTGSSKLISAEKGLYRSPHGFEIATGASGWIQGEVARELEGPAGTSNEFASQNAIEAIYLAPQPDPAVAEALAGAKKTAASPRRSSGSAALTVRVDQLEKDVALDRYVNRWLKEYPRYGFDVLNSKPFALDKQRAYVIDLVNRDGGKQVRQVIFMKKRTVAILTCRDRIAAFNESLKGCNDIIRTFHWRQ
jgi:hypothetical protein